MHVVIAEQQHIGHYYTYARRIIEAAKELTKDVTLLVTPEGLQSAEFKTNLSASLDGVNVRDSLQVPRPGMVASSWDRVRAVQRAVAECRPDMLYVPTGDQVAEAVGLVHLAGWNVLPRRVAGECLMTRLTFTYPGARRTVPAELVLRALRRSAWSRIHIIDLLAYDWLRQNTPELAERFSVIPDPVEKFAQLSRTEARRNLGVPENGRYLVCPGILVARKGIDLLIEAFRMAKLSSQDRILLAGPVGPDVREILERGSYKELIANQRVLVVDRYLNAEELGCVLSAADIVCCPYPQQWHPSSIAVKALACNRPVLGADSFWLGRMIPRFEMGWTVDVHDPAAFSTALPRVLDASEQWTLSEAGRRLVEFQSIEQFKNCWMQGLRQKLGLPSITTGRPWAWVEEALAPQAKQYERRAAL